MRIHENADTSFQARSLPSGRRVLQLSVTLSLALCLGACASLQQDPRNPKAHLPLLVGWFDGEEVMYVTTDVSHADVAEAKGANFAPRLMHAVPESPESKPLGPSGPSSLDKVYAVTNFTQGSVFASAPSPMGHGNRFHTYSPLWRMITVTWRADQTARPLKSEEEVLDAAEKGVVTLDVTNVVLNCPIVHRGLKGGLPGVTFDQTVR